MRDETIDVSIHVSVHKIIIKVDESINCNSREGLYHARTKPWKNNLHPSACIGGECGDDAH